MSWIREGELTIIERFCANIIKVRVDSVVRSWQVLQGGNDSVAAVLWKGSAVGKAAFSAGTGCASLNSIPGWEIA